MKTTRRTMRRKAKAAKRNRSRETTPSLLAMAQRLFGRGSRTLGRSGRKAAKRNVRARRRV